MLISAFLLSSCGVASKVEGFLMGNDKQYTEEDVVYLPMESVKTLNPVISKDEDTYHISKLLYDGLFRLDDAMVPQNDLVQSYRYEDSGTSMEITLRSGVTWHDGKPLRAEDAVFSIEAYKQLAKTGEGLYSDYVKGIKSAKAENDHTLKIEYYEKSANNIVNLIFPIVPAHSYKNVADFIAKGKSQDFIPVGTGPYKVEQYNRLSDLTLVANPDYFGAKAQNTVIFEVLPNKKNAVNLLKSGELSLLYNNAADRDTLISDPDIKILNYPANKFEMIAFNTSKAPFSDKKVRKAIAYATDSGKLLEKAYYNAGILSDSIFFPGYFGLENGGELYAYDIDKAKARLQQAGYQDRNSDGYVEDKDGNEIEIRILIDRDNASRSLAAASLKESLEPLGVTVVIDAQAVDTYHSILNHGDYDIAIVGVQMNERYDLSTLLSSAGGNVARYENKKADKYVLEMNGAIDNTEKAETAAELKKILVDEIPYYCIFYRTYGIFYTDTLQGNPAPSYNYLYRGCEQWSSRYEKVF